MNFKQWLLNEESIEQNFNQWIEDIKKYAQPNELELKTINVDEKQKQLIIQALKKANQEKQEYIKYLLGFVKNKPHALPEDFDRSLDAIKWAITTNKINKQQIANDGWYNTGKKAQDIIRMKDEEDSSVSKRQIAKEKKSGISSDLTPEFVSGNFKIYFIPKITNQKENKDNRGDFLKLKITNERHKLLCKYGKDTGWCTASPTGTYHANYAHRDIYVVHENDKPIYQFTGCTKQNNDNPDDDTCQFMDVEDHPAKKIPYELAELIMEKLPEIGKFYQVVISSIIKNTKIESLEDLLKILKIKTLDDFTYDYFKYFKNSRNIDLIAEIIIKNKLKLDVHDIDNIITYADDKGKIAKMIISKKPEFIFHYNFFELVKFKISEKEKYNIVELIINKNQELNSFQLESLLKLPNKREYIGKIAKLIINKKKELSSMYVNILLDKVSSQDKITNKDQIAELIINKKEELSSIDVRSLLFAVTNKDKLAELIINKKQELFDRDVFYLLFYSTNKDFIAEKLGKNNINKLSGKSVSELLNKPIDLDQMVRILEKNNIIKLEPGSSSYLISHAADPDKMAKILGSDIISEIPYYYVLTMIEDSKKNQLKMAKIINKYHQKKTPEIQKLIDKYL